MRSSTASDLPGRCHRCWLREAFCLCADVPVLSTPVKVIVVRHAREALKSTGTARIAQLALPGLTMVDYDEDPALAAEALAGVTGHLLYPSDTPAPWPAPPSTGTLVLVDGTWRQSRRMVKKLPSLDALPRLSLDTPAPKVLRLRASCHAEGRSTLEALADALALLDGPEVAQALHLLHTTYVERVYRARGVWAQKQGED